MAYERQYYTNGDVLEARQLNHMESGIKENSDNVGKLSKEIIAVNNGIYHPVLIWEQGNITGDGESVSINHIRSKMFELVKEPLCLDIAEGYTCRVRGYTDSTALTESYVGTWETGKIELYKLSPQKETRYVRIVLANSNTTSINTSYSDKVDVYFRVPKKNPYIVVGSANLADNLKASCDYICDGVSDEVEINKAIRSLPTTGGTVHLTAGLFTVSDSIKLDRPVNFEGEGSGLTLDVTGNTNVVGTTIKSANNSVNVIEIVQSSYSHKGFKIHDMQITGNGVRNRPANIGIKISYTCDLCQIYNCDINNMGVGIYAKDIFVDAISISNNSIQRNMLGIFMNNVDQSRIENNIIWDSYGYYNHGALFDSLVLNCGGIAIKGNCLTILGNTLGRPSFDDNGNNKDSKGNQNARYALNIFGGTIILVSGNTFSDGFMTLLNVTGAYGVSINGNTFRKYGVSTYEEKDRSAITVIGSHKTSIVGNLFYASGSEGITEARGLYEDSASDNTVCMSNTAYGMTGEEPFLVSGNGSVQHNNVAL